jgi:hypothetical protein
MCVEDETLLTCTWVPIKFPKSNTILIPGFQLNSVADEGEATLRVVAVILPIAAKIPDKNDIIRVEKFVGSCLKICCERLKLLAQSCCHQSKNKITLATPSNNWKL